MLAALDIPGWLDADECIMLHHYARSIKGPILEIGHFMGRSTACICQAIRDNHKAQRFVSYDMAFASAEEHKAFYDEVHKRDNYVPNVCREVFARGMTATEVARENLTKVDLDKYVTLISGNFKQETGTFDLIFCDAAHEPHEIKLNIPSMVTMSNPGCTWVVHDMGDAEIKLVEEISPVKFVHLVKPSLGVFKFDD